jgi:hypothetical protein
MHHLDPPSMESPSLDSHGHCHNARCEDPQCENPNCYNYSGTNRRQQYERDNDNRHDIDGRNHHYPNYYHGVLQNILQRHYNHQDNFSDAQSDVIQHQQTLQTQQLQWVDHVLNGLVRSVLERSQHELYERGFSSGIQSQIESMAALDNHEHSHAHIHSENHDYLTAITLNFNDTPSNDPSKNITSNNQIRFYRVTDSLDIQCQFSNTKMQSKIFDLSFHHGMGTDRHTNHNEQCNQNGGAQALVEDVVQDFISFILLSKRAALSNASG